MKSMKHSTAVRLFFFTSSISLLRARIWVSVVLSKTVLVFPQVRVDGMPDPVKYHAVVDLCSDTGQADASVVVWF